MVAFLVVIGVLLVGAGFLGASQATIGVYLACAGCFVAILARIGQAEAQHTAVMKGRSTPPATAPSQDAAE